MCTPLGSAPRPRCTPQSQMFGWEQYPALASPLLSSYPLFLWLFNQKGRGCSMQRGPCPSVAKSKPAAVRGHHPAADTVLSPKIALHDLPGILQAKSSVRICVHACGFVHACIYFCASISLCAFVHACIFVCTLVHVLVSVHASVHFFPCMYTCAYVGACVHVFCVHAHVLGIHIFGAFMHIL